MSEPTLHVLIVVHRSAEQIWLRNALRSGTKRHCVFHEADSGLQGLNFCRSATAPQFDIALVELALPDMRGVHFLETLRGDHVLAPFPIIVLPDNLHDPEIEAAIAAGAQDFLVKTDITPALLARVIASTTERFRLLQKLHASETYFHTLADSIPVLLWESGTDNKSTFFNQHWLRFTGRSLDQELDDAWETGVHPDDYEHCMSTYYQAFAARQEFEVEYRLRRHDGVYRWVLDRGVPRFTPAGVFLGYTGGCIDITERKEMEEALRWREAQNRALIATMPDNVARMDRAGNYLEVHLTGDLPFPYAAQSLIGRNLFDVMPAETAQLILTTQQRAIDTGITQRVEYERILNGKTFYLESHIGASGENECVAVVRNVTERRLAEETIRYQANLLDQVMDAIISTDLEFRIRSWNRAAAELYGLQLGEVLGKQLNEVVRIEYSHGNRQQAIEKLARDGFWQGETIQYCKDATPLYILSSVSYIVDRNGKRIGTVAANRDITEHKRTEQLLLRAQKYESVSMLAGGIAHDFNNLLTGVLGQASLASQKLPADHEARDHIEKATRSTQRAADLTRQLLAYTGQGAFHIEAIGLNQLIQDNLGLFETVLPKQAQIEVALTDNLPAIEIDRGQAQQLIMNLVINAAEAIPSDQGHILIETGETNLTPDESDTYLGAEQLAPGRYVFLKVIDNGVGMSEATLARIFDPYFTTKKTGSGLGLSATLGIVQRSKGGLQVTSQPGQGTIFCVLFPASAATPAVPLVLATDAHPLNGTVLVVDDEAPVREVISDILSSEGMRVLLASNGVEGIQQYEEHQADIDLVLLDMKMPVMNGEQAFYALRAINPTLKIILSSGYLDVDATMHLAGQRFTTFLQKPYDLQKLIVTIQAMVNSAA